jgi:hypothetical protein
VITALTACVDSNDPHIKARVVSADDRQVCVVVQGSQYSDLSTCYPVDPHGPPLRAGDCITARFPSLGKGPRPGAPIYQVKILGGGCDF